MEGEIKNNIPLYIGGWVCIFLVLVGAGGSLQAAVGSWALHKPSNLQRIFWWLRSV